MLRISKTPISFPFKYKKKVIFIHVFSLHILDWQHPYPMEIILKQTKPQVPLYIIASTNSPCLASGQSKMIVASFQGVQRRWVVYHIFITTHTQLTVADRNTFAWQQQKYLQAKKVDEQRSDFWKFQKIFKAARRKICWNQSRTNSHTDTWCMTTHHDTSSEAKVNSKLTWSASTLRAEINRKQRHLGKTRNSSFSIPFSHCSYRKQENRRSLSSGKHT